MFTGIIRTTGILVKKEPSSTVISFFIKASKLKLALGDSISINGVCLTVTRLLKEGFVVDVIPETAQRTTLNSLQKEARLNLEPSLKIGDTLDGHFVNGHVDATTTLVTISKNMEMTFMMPKKLTHFIAEKGSITINGVSLTVTEVTKKTFSVALIPFTMKHTNLGALQAGEKVNLEVDLIARYVYNFHKKA